MVKVIFAGSAPEFQNKLKDAIIKQGMGIYSNLESHNGQLIQTLAVPASPIPEIVDIEVVSVGSTKELEQKLQTILPKGFVANSNLISHGRKLVQVFVKAKEVEPAPEETEDKTPDMEVVKPS